MSDSFLDVTLDPDGPDRIDDRTRALRHMGQVRQYAKTGVISDVIDEKYIPTEDELDEVLLNREYANRYESLKRNLGQQKAVAAAAVLKFRDGSRERTALLQRLLDLDNATYDLGALKRDMKPLSIRVFTPLPFELMPQRVDTAAEKEPLLTPRSTRNIEDELS